MDSTPGNVWRSRWFDFCRLGNAAISQHSVRQQARTSDLIALIMSANELKVDGYSSIVTDGSESDGEFTSSEIYRRNNLQGTISIFENDYFQFLQGLMPQEIWDAKLIALTYWYNLCDMREIIDWRKNFFPQGLIEIIDNLPDRCTD